MRRNEPDGPLKLVRCAVYTRKSTEEGLQQEFNSLDAQRESAEAFIASQQHEGRRCLPERYDDGGFSGGSMERPALKRLMADIEAGRVDCVVVYKVDRLSRSLLDFASMMRSFDDRGISFVSVTQQFNTGSSMGRLVLNVLLSFAQFEREIISERTRDKIAATRRKGKWAGGRPVLGYDLDRERSRLVVNEEEATLVRGIFDLYLQRETLLPVVQELERRGWKNKAHRTKAGKVSGGEAFVKTSLHRLLTNPLYVGLVKYKGETHQGEHPALIDGDTWSRTQALLRRNSVGGGEVRNRFGALLKGLLFCEACSCAMTPSHTKAKGGKRYRFYTCTNAQQRGWAVCPAKSVPAGEIERVVVEQVEAAGKDPTLAGQALAEARRQDDRRLAELEAERKAAERDVARDNRDADDLTARLRAGGDAKSLAPRLAALHDRIAQNERRADRARREVKAAAAAVIDERAAREALEGFAGVWGALSPQEQTQLVGLLVQRVGYDGREGKVAITLHDSGIRALAEKLSEHRQRGEVA
jgi:site-specific DNA recombinase